MADGKGLSVERRFTDEGRDPFDTIEWSTRNSKITNPDGSVVFEMQAAEIPASWSQVATDIMVSKYFRKAGVPQLDADGSAILDDGGNPVSGSERSARQVISRLAETWRWWGEEHSYFSSAGDADAFEDELKYMLVHQMAAPNSPQWFNTGLNHNYGLTGTSEGFWYVDPDTEELIQSPDSYSRPAPHACFIQSVDDDLVNPGGIMDLWVREARLFKFGSGTGSNFSSIRAEGERLSGGGKSSGLMSFLRVGDRAAGAIKSGGTTRRAAKMVILDLDHPDIETFIAWKANEEDKVRALIAAGYPADFNGEAYQTVSGQNSNNSVRIPTDFVQAVKDDGIWELTSRTNGEVVRTVRARELWQQIAEAAWKCADPGVQFDTTINEWHTCPQGGRIRASNPCSEYMFLDNTACNLASLNLVKFMDAESGEFNIDEYRHAIRIWTMVLEISVTMAQFPSAEIAQGSYDYRTLGLGYANLGSLLMRWGIPYDSDEGRAIAGALTAVLTGYSYATSAEMAAALGAFPKFEENRDDMLRVMRNHRNAAYNGADDYDDVTTTVIGIDPNMAPSELIKAARDAWDLAVSMGEEHGYRNAQATVLAPTGTIGLLMDCDTTGVEPDFALVKFKKLAGGGYFKIANQSVEPALKNLGYMDAQCREIVDYVVGTMTLAGAPHVNKTSLSLKGFTSDEIATVESTLPGVFDLKHAFNVFVIGEDAMRRLGFIEEQYTSWDFDLLSELGYTRSQVADANDVICGRQTIEGAPHLLETDLPVFDTANKNGKLGERFIYHTGHIKMMAAVQPFISGAISKTINMPNEVTVDEIEDSYMMSSELGLKAMALYRDGSKASQPLSASSDDGDSEEVEEELTMALEAQAQVVTGMFAPGASPSQAYDGVNRPRFLLPARRTGFTQEARIGGHKVFLRTGDYEDGTLGEVFIDLAKEGATLRGILSCFAIAVSKGLQYGVPLEEFVDTFTFHTFEPRGMVEGHPNIKMANSIVDYVFRALGMEYLGRHDLVQVPPTESDLPAPPKGLAVDAGLQLELNESAMEDDIDAQTRAAAFVDSPDPFSGGGNGGSPTKHFAQINLMPKPEPANVAVGVVAAGGLEAEAAPTPMAAAVRLDSMDAALGEMMGDAPLCETCGHITVRNGGCYRCLNCGNSVGCS